MRYSSDMRITVQPSLDTVMTQDNGGSTMRYCNDTSVPVDHHKLL